MTSPFEERIKASLDAIFLPARTLKPEHLSRYTLGLICFLLLLTAMLAEPHVRDHVAADIFNIDCLVATTKGSVAQYLDFANIMLQVLIAFVLGGIFLTDDIVTATERWAKAFEAARIKASEQQQAALVRDVEAALAKAWTATSDIAFGNALARYIQLYKATKDVSDILAIRIPKWYARLIFLRLASSFPKGFYGVLALFAFEGVLVVQVVQTYFTYLPDCQ